MDLIKLAKRASNQVRIIGGVHRGRRLPFADQPGLRPTGDRVRETLFNWLQPTIQGARCLDLFSGSGALGFEAASRGAKEVVMLDSANKVIQQLEVNKRLLGLDQIRLRQTDAMRWLDKSPKNPFNLVFLDPPFAIDLLSSACQKLAANAWLTEAALVYLEIDAGRTFPDLPAGWELLKEKRVGQVRFGLVRV